MNAKVVMAAACALAVASCDRPSPTPTVPLASAPDAPSAAPSASKPPATPFRAVVEVVRADDGTPDVPTQAAVPLLCYDGNAWIADRGSCLARLREGVAVHARAGTWRTTDDVTTVFDRDYQGVVLPEGAPSGLAFVGVNGVPENRCRSQDAAPALGSATWTHLSPRIPAATTFTSGYPGNARSRVFEGDFDGDGVDDRLYSITLGANGGRLDVTALQRADDVRVLSQEWSVGDAFGGAPERRLVDVRSLTCFDLDGRPGLEIVASLRGETEREHLAFSFDGPDLLPVGHAVFFGD